MNWNKLPFCFLGSLLALGAATAGDWPQYRGPNQDGIAPEPAALHSLKPVWKVPANLGFSSFSIAGGVAYTQVSRDGRVYIRSTKEGACLEAK
jgi:hypothetical protein